jgi:hypothetical protein
VICRFRCPRSARSHKTHPPRRGKAPGATRPKRRPGFVRKQNPRYPSPLQLQRRLPLLRQEHHEQFRPLRIAGIP